jgi:hypothetical protein
LHRFDGLTCHVVDAAPLAEHRLRRCGKIEWIRSHATAPFRAKLEQITRGASVKGIFPDGLVAVVDVRWIGTVAIEVTYKDSAARLGNELIYRDREPTLEVAEVGPWSFNGDSALSRLVSEANRIRLAYLFDPLLAVHTSLERPLENETAPLHRAGVLRISIYKSWPRSFLDQVQMKAPRSALVTGAAGQEPLRAPV